MVHADEILESLVVACKQHGDLPADVTYSTIVLDSGGDHSNVTPPVIELTVDEIQRDQSRNTERVGSEYDENGNEIGYIFTRWYDMRVLVEVLSVDGSGYSHRSLDQKLDRTLFRYDNHDLHEPLPDPDNPNENLCDINWVVVDETAPDNDFAMSPSIRTRTKALDIGFTHEFRTTDLGIEYDVVEDVEIPNAGLVSDDN